MLDDGAYRDYLNQCGFSDAAHTLLTNICRSPSVRCVVRPVPKKRNLLALSGQAHALEPANRSVTPLENDKEGRQIWPRPIIHK